MLSASPRGSRGERPKPWSLDASITRERLATFARDIGRAVRAGKPLPPPLLHEAQALHAAVFDDALRELSAHLLEASKSQPLLQRLFIPDRDLQSVPWEALCERDSSVDFWGSSDKLLIARGVASSSPGSLGKCAARSASSRSVRSAAWSPNGKRIVTASHDTTARIWSFSLPALQQALRDATTDCLTHAMRRTYLDETEAESRERYEACERSHGRVPFSPEDSPP